MLKLSLPVLVGLISIWTGSPLSPSLATKAVNTVAFVSSPFISVVLLVRAYRDI